MRVLIGGKSGHGYQVDIGNEVAEHRGGHSNGPDDVFLVAPNTEVDVLLPQNNLLGLVRTIVSGRQPRHKRDGAQHQQAHYPSYNLLNCFINLILFQELDLSN